MDGETIVYLILVGGGIVVVIATMIFVINPPEAWIKRAFHKKPKLPADSSAREQEK